MPWLAVTGKAKWGAGRDLPWFEPGVHEVSEEIAEIARRDAPPRVVVCDEKPEITREQGEPPLSLDDLRVGVDDAVRLRREDIPDVPEETIEDDDVPDNYPCDSCSASFPTEPPLMRHIELHHAVRFERITAEREAEEEEARLAREEAERLTRAMEDDLHPAEREALDPEID